VMSTEEISFTGLSSSLLRRRKTIASVTFTAAVVTSLVAFLIPPRYSAEAVILTPQQGQSSLSAMAQLAGVGSGAGLSSLSLLSGFGLHNAADLYIGILESRTIADGIIARFDLRRVYNAKDFYATRKHLARNTTIKSGRDTLIHILVEDRDPKRSAELANAYVEELARQNSTVALTEASQRRLFFEAQLAKEKDVLSDAEIGMRNTEQFTGLMAPAGQAEALLRSVSQLHAEILSRRAQLEGMRTYIADENPRFLMVKRELGALQDELGRL
jgi:tyrosine-protein kinase Etk/Wzc